VTGWLKARVPAKGEITLDERVAGLAQTPASPATVPPPGGCCAGAGRHAGKALQALEQKRQDVAGLRHVWIARRQPFLANPLERVAFIDGEA
jgi:hypothetical protein